MDFEEPSSFFSNDDSCLTDVSNIFHAQHKKKPALTNPKTPMLMKHQPRFQRQNYKTTEELELERIKEYKAQMAKKKLATAKERRRSQTLLTCQIKKDITKLGFNFATDNRVKVIEAHKESEALDFVKTLRKHEDFNFNPCRTRPEPFVFHGKEVPKENIRNVVTFAEQCEKFNKKTPARFRTKPRQETEKPSSFVNFSNNEISNSSQFRAKPFNRKILEGAIGLKPLKRMPLTVPQSPSFSRLNAKKVIEPKDEDSLPSGIPKICPLPLNNSPFKPSLQHRRVEPAPFSFEMRDKQMIQKKEEKIERVYQAEKEAREFYANPLPDWDVNLPVKRPKPATVPDEFDFEIGKRMAVQHEKWQNKLLQERKIEKDKATFKARRATILEKQPFLPEKPSSKGHEISILEEFIPNNLEKRAAAWEDTKKHQQYKQKEAEECMMLREQRMMEEGEEEIKKMREQTVHKAQPIRSFKTVCVETSKKPLTDPKTPKFSRRLTERYLKKQ